MQVGMVLKKKQIFVRLLEIRSRRKFSSLPFVLGVCEVEDGKDENV